MEILSVIPVYYTPWYIPILIISLVVGLVLCFLCLMDEHMWALFIIALLTLGCIVLVIVLPHELPVEGQYEYQIEITDNSYYKYIVDNYKIIERVYDNREIYKIQGEELVMGDLIIWTF